MYKKEWSPADFQKVNRKIKSYFGGKSFKNHRGEVVTVPTRFYDIEMFLGLPYTSSGIYACYSLSCNTNLFLDADFYFDHVAMFEDGQVILVLNDINENEKLIKL